MIWLLFVIRDLMKKINLKAQNFLKLVVVGLVALALNFSPFGIRTKMEKLMT
jgi:hypothetical protein